MNLTVHFVGKRRFDQQQDIIDDLNHRMVSGNDYDSRHWKALPNAISTPELHWKLKEGEPHALVAQLQKNARFEGATEVITIDGVRVEYPDGFGLARASNTTPVMVLRFEAETDAALTRIKEDFRRVLMAAKGDVPLPY